MEPDYTLIDKIRQVMREEKRSDWSASEMLEELRKKKLIHWTVDFLEVHKTMKEFLNKVDYGK